MASLYFLSEAKHPSYLFIKVFLKRDEHNSYGKDLIEKIVACKQARLIAGEAFPTTHSPFPLLPIRLNLLFSISSEQKNTWKTISTIIRTNFKQESEEGQLKFYFKPNLFSGGFDNQY